MTDNKEIGYNKGSPLRCTCGRVAAFMKDGKVYVKCKDCRKWVAVLTIKKVQ